MLLVCLVLEFGVLSGVPMQAIVGRADAAAPSAQSGARSSRWRGWWRTSQPPRL